MKAKKMEIAVWNNQFLGLSLNKIGLEGSPTRVVKIFTPESPSKGEIVEGDSNRKADRIIEEIKKRNLLKWLQ